MVDWSAYLMALGVNAVLAMAAWMYSVVRKDVSIVDSLWSLMILSALVSYLLLGGVATERGTLVLALVSVWAIRLSLHITVRNHGKPEDRRYQAIRANNQPRFWLKSLYIVFGLQGVLAWLIALPLLPAITSAAPLGVLDGVAVLLWITGFIFEEGGDFQLARFKSDEANKGKTFEENYVVGIDCRFI